MVTWYEFHVCYKHNSKSFFNPGQICLGQYCNIHIFLSFLGSLLKQCHPFQNLLAVLPPPHPIQSRKSVKIQDSRYTRPTWVREGWACVNWKTSQRKLMQKCSKTFGRISETLLTNYGKVLNSVIYLHYIFIKTIFLVLMASFNKTL